MAALQGSGQGMNNLTTLIKRLEAATSRLEDIAQSASNGESPADQQHDSISAASGAPASNSMPELTGASKGGSREDSTTSTVQPVKLPPSIEEMDDLIKGEVADFQEASKGLDPLIEEQASSVEKAFADQRRFLLTTTRSKKPDTQSKAFMDLLSDLQQDMGSVGDIRDSNRASPMKEHLAMVGEGITALQWLIIDGKPADYVADVVGGAQMYGNRVLTKYKDGEQAHVKYVRSYYALLKALQDYIKKHYPSGVTWNNNGESDAVAVYRDVDSSEASSTVNGVTPSSTGGRPPPPPPPLPNFDNNPPPPPPPGPAPSNKAAGGDMGAVFDQLNRGEAVTAGLKKVDKSQMTHKNPSLRAASTVPDKDSSATDISRSRSPGPEIKPKPQSMRQNSSASTAQSKPKPAPQKELDGNKWLISNHDSPSSPIELEVSLTQSILITNCKNTTIILHGKANAISIDNSPKLQILIDSLVSSVDVIKCPNFAVQITGSLPTIMLDQVDGAQIYLSKESLATEVFTSKCSGVNVVLPPEGEEEDSRECALPEQMRTVVKGGKLVSEIVEHAG